MAGPRRFGATWWGRSWIDALERSGTGTGYESRLPRGRTYARKGAVREIDLRPGHIAARVVGSGGELYRVDIGVKQLAQVEWEQVADAIAGRAAHLAALLDGELDPGVVDDAAAVDVQLLPRAADLRPDCSCPDWAEPCKHAAAVCYVAAQELDRNPFTLFLLRGIDRDALIELVRSRRGDADIMAVPAEQAPPGIEAQALWSGRSLDDPLPPPPTVPGGARAALRQPGRHVPWGAEPPAHLGIDPSMVDELAEDAVARAWLMLVDDQRSGLVAAPSADLARRAAASRDSLATLAARAGVTSGRLATWAEAWTLGGDHAVEVLADAATWSTDQVLLGAGRDQLVDLGHPRRSVALNYDSLSMAATIWLVIGPEGRWYRLHGHGKHHELRLAMAPAEDLRDLVDPPSGS